MAINVTFYTLNKRSNSTRQPTAAGSTQSCVLKDDTSVINPIIEVSTNIGNPRAYNYAYIGDFARYYYISDWTYDKGLWSAHLSVDVLASYKSEIGNTSAYIEYSSSNYDELIPDDRAHASPVIQKATNTLDFRMFSSTGCFILTLLSTDTNGDNGACATYALNATMMQAFSSTINSSSFLDTIWDSVNNTFVNPQTAILSCKWIPISYDSITGTDTEIHVVYKGTGCAGRLITSNFKDFSGYLDVPKHTTPIDWSESPQYATCTLYLPFVGTVPVDLSAIYPDDRIRVLVRLDLYTGDIVYAIKPSDPDLGILSTYSGNCSTDIPMSSSKVDVGGMVGSSVSVIGGIVTAIKATKPTTMMTGIAASVAGTVGEVRSAEVHSTINGRICSRIGSRVSLDMELTVMYNYIPDAGYTSRITNLGAPCFQTFTINRLSGYVKCSGASVSASCTRAELDQINNYLDSGFYYE